MINTASRQKLLIIFGTRPEAIKLFPVVAALRVDPRFLPVVCTSGQHREMLDQVLQLAGLVPDHDLDLMRPGQSLDGLTAALLTELGQVMDREQPARVMVQGDTATAMAGALAAYYRRIPVDHVEAGLRSGQLYHPWPEEGARRIIAVTCHRRENLDGALVRIASAVRRIAARPDVAVIFPVHPNPAVRTVMQAALDGVNNVALLPPLDYPHFVHLLTLADLVLTDSGGVQEEAPVFGKPVLVLRETTERPEGVAAVSTRLVGTDPDRIVAEVTRLLDDAAAYQAMALARSPYGDGRAARRIVAAIAAAIG